ncbi:MAG TPA: acyl-CoA dehydrogenase family protein [Sphingobium sp.]|nr:acyl-CoA dehydrogenase family protein [Sphingobium sp.]
MLQVQEKASANAGDFETLIAGVRKVAAETKARAGEIDTTRKFPVDLFDEIESTGAFRMLSPKEYGGLELTLANMNEVVFEAARGNGSLGWLMMVGTAQSIGNGLFPEETVRSINRDFPDVRIRGVIAPKGQAVPVEGGYMISGQWPFASGGPNPDFVAGNCIIMEGGKPKMSPEGDPEMVLAMVPAPQAEFLDTWYVLGMRGTDSCDVAIRDVFVPSAMTYNLHDIKTCYDTPASRLPLRVALSLPHCAVALGLAQGALDDLIELCKTKRSSMNPKMLLGDDVVFRHELGKQVVRLEGSKGMLDSVTANVWKAGEDHRALTPKEVLVSRLAANFITGECAEIVNWAYTVVGSSSVYDGSSLQRRLRDIHIATQHASCHADPYRNLGAAMLGVELTPRELF